MLHPSYADLINVVNSGVEPGEQPVVQSRYSIVLASAKRARQLIEEDAPLKGGKPLSEAIQEIYDGRVKIIGDSEEEMEGEKEEAGKEPEEANLGEEDTEDSQKEENLEETQEEHHEEE